MPVVLTSVGYYYDLGSGSVIVDFFWPKTSSVLGVIVSRRPQQCKVGVVFEFAAIFRRLYTCIANGNGYRSLVSLLWSFAAICKVLE